MHKRHLRYTVEVDGQHRKILSVSDQRTGLIFDFKPAPGHRSNPDSSTVDGTVEYDRGTFHHSARSRIGNLITRTNKNSHGVIRKNHFTRAIKTTNLLAPVAARRLPNFSLDWPEYSSTPGDVNLGHFDPKRFNFLYYLFAGKINQNVVANDPVLHENINIVQSQIGDYKLIMLYCFYNMPSIDHGLTLFNHTFHPETIPEYESPDLNDEMMKGSDSYDVFEKFFRIENLCYRNFYELTGETMGERCKI